MSKKNAKDRMTTHFDGGGGTGHGGARRVPKSRKQRGRRKGRK